ncbi:hypothetical protein [Winogradskyella algicola]|uniref:hypothetical protein n=1 Tax=Winogradskyella algicola TaxID=2575815 RepID=UPI001109D066|nr:hypothetical protein [Winogradskyella algicola]
MKYKNYKSAIHNFTHSFMSIDYMKSGRLAVNVLIDLYKIGKENRANFDFINREIKPKEAESKASRQLLNDYLNWLPEHFKNHDCDLTKLEKLDITIWTDFSKAISPLGMHNKKGYNIYALTKWKADEGDEQTVEISQFEFIEAHYLNIRLPEF